VINNEEPAGPNQRSKVRETGSENNNNNLDVIHTYPWKYCILKEGYPL
jgi:hypothetical protein